MSDKTVCISKLCGSYTFLIACIKITVADIIHNCSCKQINILQNYTNRTAEVAFLDFIYVNAIIANLTVCNIIKSIDKVCYSCFACTSCTNKSNLLSRLGIKCYVMQNYLVFNIAKIYIVKLYFSLKLCIGYCSIWMWVFPSPYSCTLLNFNEFIIFAILYIDKSYITIINLWFFVHKLENSFCTCKSHNNCIELLGNLSHRLCEWLRKL